MPSISSGLSRRNEICDGSHAHKYTDEIERHLFQFQQQLSTQNDFERDFPFIPLLLIFYFLRFCFLLSVAIKIVLFIVFDMCVCVNMSHSL